MFTLIKKHRGFPYRTLGSVDKHLSFLLACTKYRNKSYYSVLGLESSASLNDIKSAYYKMSMRYHPDKNFGCQDAAVKFREITEAYEVLSNADKKLKYDQETLRSQYKKPFEGYPYERSTTHTYREPREPRTGRSKEFNYDEHFQKHYEEVFRRNQEQLRMMRQAQKNWQRDPYSNPYARRSGTRPSPDAFNNNRAFAVPWSAVTFVWVIMVFFFISELMKGDVPRTSDFVDRPSKK